RAVSAMEKFTAAGGEFEHLTKERKYVATSGAMAMQRGVPHGRSVVRLQERRIKGVDDVVKSVSNMENLPAELKDKLALEMAQAITNGAGRVQNADRTAELAECQREICAVAEKYLGKAHSRAERAEAELQAARDEISFLRDIVRARMP